MRAEKQQDGKVATVFLPLSFPTSGASHPHPVIGPGKRQEMGLVDPKAALYVVFPTTPNPVKVQKKIEFSRLSDNSGFGKSGPAITTKAFKVNNMLRVSYNVAIFLLVNQIAIQKS